MSTTYSGPTDRKINAVVEIANTVCGTDEIDGTGDRLVDALERLADKVPGKVANKTASSAADVASLKADFNNLIIALKDAGVMVRDEFTMQFSTVTDSVSGRSDRQDNTDEIDSVAEDDGVITITLKKKVSALKDFDAGGNWGTHKWLGIGVGVGINPITGLKYNGTYLGAEDVTEATQVGLSGGYFVRWVAADLVLAGDETKASKSTFKLWASGHEETTYKLKIVEPS